MLHLCGKVKSEMLGYRPTAKQRSTLELLRYLTVMGPGLVKSVKAGEFLEAEWGAAQSAADQMDFDAVVKSLASQSAVYEQAVGEMSDGAFQAEIELFGHKAKRGVLLVTLVAGGHAAYRTQLFCYLKACGRDELNTSNLWGGVDS